MKLWQKAIDEIRPVFQDWTSVLTSAVLGSCRNKRPDAACIWLPQVWEGPQNALQLAAA